MTIPNSNVSTRLVVLAESKTLSILLIQCRLLRKSKINISSNCNLVRSITKESKMRVKMKKDRKLLLSKWKIICNKEQRVEGDCKDFKLSQLSFYFFIFKSNGVKKLKNINFHIPFMLLHVFLVI